jgi:hypothetical protein
LKQYRARKLLAENNWKYSITPVEKLSTSVFRKKLFYWFNDNSLIPTHPLYSKVQENITTFNEKYVYGYSTVMKKSVIRGNEKTVGDSLKDLGPLYKSVKNLFEDWLTEDEEFRTVITKDESFSSQFQLKMHRRDRATSSANLTE